MRYLLAVAVLVLPSCEQSTAPDPWPDRPGIERIEPRPEYAGWYAAVEGCIGLTGDFDAVRWFVADDVGEGPVYSGEFFPPHDIVVKRGRDTRGNVQHEAAHHILELNGDTTHRTHDHSAFLACNLYHGGVNLYRHIRPPA